MTDVRVKSKTMREATEHAAGLLDTIWRREDPVVLPVDPIKIARDLGFGVYLADMKDGASGAMYMRRDGEGQIEKTIYLNKDHAPVRQRFSCAHELGHYMRKLMDGQLEGEHVEWRDDRARAGTDPVEIYANQFAAALLMPEDEVLARRGAHPAQLAYVFSVSDEAMRIRLDNLGL